MKFETRFTVCGAPGAVVERMADVPLMASFLPGASVDAPNADGSYPATLVASFGPKKIAFKGTLTNRVDQEALNGVLAGQASADVRGARMALTMNYRLAPAEHGPASPPATHVWLESEAQLTGVLAEFARRFSAHMEALASGHAMATPTENPANSGTLSPWTLLAAMLRWLRLRLIGSKA